MLRMTLRGRPLGRPGRTRIRNPNRARAAILVVPFLLVAGGCGYRLAGKGAGVLPSHVKSFVVAPFENRTQRTEIEQRVTEEVALQLSTRGPYKVVTNRSGADAILEGTVTGYRTAPVQFTDELLANRLEAIVTLQATVRDLSTDEILWSQDGLIFKQQFEILQGEAFFDQEGAALDQIARGAALVVVTSILEGF